MALRKGKTGLPVQNILIANHGTETIAAGSVRALGLEMFLPMVNVEDLESAVIKAATKPLFPGYFFARFCPAVSLDSVESARGVLHVVKSGSCPIPVEELVVREIQERVEADGLVHLEPCRLQAGDRVWVQDGPFAGMVGRVEMELDDRKRVAILLETLWNARVLIAKQWVQAEAVQGL